MEVSKKVILMIKLPLTGTKVIVRINKKNEVVRVVRHVIGKGYKKGIY